MVSKRKRTKQWVVWNYLEPFSKVFQDNRHNKSRLVRSNHIHSCTNNNYNNYFKPRTKWVIKDSNMKDGHTDEPIGQHDNSGSCFKLNKYDRNGIKKMIDRHSKKDKDNIMYFKKMLIKCIRSIYLIANLDSMINKHRKIPINKFKTLQKLWHIDWYDNYLIKQLHHYNLILLKNHIKQVRNSAFRQLNEYKYQLKKVITYLLCHIDKYLLQDLVFDFINTKVKSVIYKLDIAMQYKFKKDHLFTKVSQAQGKLVVLIGSNMKLALHFNHLF